MIFYLFDLIEDNFIIITLLSGSTMIGESILPVMHIIATEVIIHHQVTILITITTVTTDQITVVTGVLTMDSTVTATMAATVPIVVGMYPVGIARQPSISHD